LRIKAALEIEQGLIVNTKLVRRIMGELGLAGLPGPKKGHKNLKNAPRCEDLVQRQFRADAPNQLWLTDITEWGQPQVERVTGIEPAYPAWKASGTRSRLRVKIAVDLRISVFDLDRCGPYWAPLYRPYGPATAPLCAFVGLVVATGLTREGGRGGAILLWRDLNVRCRQTALRAPRA
jgi:hypothetical protein